MIPSGMKMTSNPMDSSVSPRCRPKEEQERDTGHERRQREGDSEDEADNIFPRELIACERIGRWNGKGHADGRRDRACYNAEPDGKPGSPGFTEGLLQAQAGRVRTRPTRTPAMTRKIQKVRARENLRIGCPLLIFTHAATVSRHFCWPVPMTL